MSKIKPTNVSQGYWDMLTEEGKRAIADGMVWEQVTAEECNRIAANYYAAGPDYAALASLSHTMGVKGLEWTVEPDRLEHPAWKAETPFGTEYRCFEVWWGSENKWAFYCSPSDAGFYNTEQEAKAAAQADYEQRIRSALTPTAMTEAYSAKGLQHPEYAHGISEAELIKEAIAFCDEELDGYEGMEYDDDCEVACQRSNIFIRELARRLAAFAPIKHTMSGVKPFDLSNLLKHAFYSGAGYTDKYKVSEADVQRWLVYNPEGLKPYERICAALAPSDAKLDAGEAAIDALRHKAFRSNSEADRQAYFDAVSKWFQHRHYRRMAHPDSSSEAVRRDAERYRYLRNVAKGKIGERHLNPPSISDWARNFDPRALYNIWTAYSLTGDDLDREIDAALAKEGE